MLNAIIQDYFYTPIRNTDIKGWENVPIRECNEKLVSLSTFLNNRVYIDSTYHQNQVSGSIEDCFTRISVARLLRHALGFLPDGYTFRIFDAWRPFAVQESLFLDYFNKLKLEHPNKSQKDIMELTKTFVSYPSDDPYRPSPHLTGGSIDLTIVTQQNDPIDMGTEFDDFSEAAKTGFFEKKIQNGETLTSIEMEQCKNRRFLYNVMTSVGFTNYPNEWWHFDFGNQFWGCIKKKLAFYSIVI